MFATGTRTWGIIVVPYREIVKNIAEHRDQSQSCNLLSITTKLCEWHTPLVIILNGCHRGIRASQFWTNFGYRGTLVKSNEIKYCMYNTCASWNLAQYHNLQLDNGWAHTLCFHEHEPLSSCRHYPGQIPDTSLRATSEQIRPFVGGGWSRRTFDQLPEKILHTAREPLSLQKRLAIQYLTFLTRVRFSCVSLRCVTMRRIITSIFWTYFICTARNRLT